MRRVVVFIAWLSLGVAAWAQKVMLYTTPELYRHASKSVDQLGPWLNEAQRQRLVRVRIVEHIRETESVAHHMYIHYTVVSALTAKETEVLPQKPERSPYCAHIKKRAWALKSLGGRLNRMLSDALPARLKTKRHESQPGTLVETSGLSRQQMLERLGPELRNLRRDVYRLFHEDHATISAGELRESQLLRRLQELQELAQELYESLRQDSGNGRHRA